MARFTKVYMDAVKELSKKGLNLQEQGLLWILTAYIDRSDNSLRDRGKDLTVSSIARIIGMSRQHTSKLLDRLVKVNALIERRTPNARYFKFDPTVASRFGIKK